MKIVITGGSGFIGTRLTELLLENNHEIRIVDKVQSTTYPELTTICDVRDLDKLTMACRGHDAIIHLAAEHADNVEPLSLYYEVNGQGTRNVAAAATTCGIDHVIFTSTVALYGLNKGNSGEDSEPEPFNDYGKSKLEGEQALQAWVLENEQNRAVIIRPAVIFGENNRGNVYNLINQVASGRFLMIGDGTNRKSMGYVLNIAHFIMYCLEKNFDDRLEIFNYADKPDMQAKKLIQIVRRELGFSGKFPSFPTWLGMLGGHIFDAISKLTGKKFPVSAIRVKKFISETLVNSSKAHGTGFEAPITLEDGLKRMIMHEFPQ